MNKTTDSQKKATKKWVENNREHIRKALNLIM